MSEDSAAPLGPQRVSVAGAGGLRLNVWDYGGDGAPLVLAHCTGTHARMWDPLVGVFLDLFRVCAVDTRAHGESDCPDGDEGFAGPLSGEDLLCVVDALSLGSGICAAGHSAGGAHICYAEIQRPGTFTRAVLIDPIIASPAQHRLPGGALAAAARRRRNRFGSRGEAEERYASKPPMNSWNADARAAYVAHAFNEDADSSVTLKCPGAVEAKFYERGGATDIFDRLEEINTEVLLVTAEGSNVRAFAQEQKTQFRRVSYHEFQETSHFIPQEKPMETAKLIRGFLRSS